MSDCANLDIAGLNRTLLEERTCGSCPLRGKPFVGADSWNGLATPANVLFLGLNPGTEEARIGLPFVGPSGRFLRIAIASVTDSGTWAMTNSILCSTSNETAIPDPKACRASCRVNVARISKWFMPRVIVPCGNGASALFEIKDGITRAENIWYISRGRNCKAKSTVVAPIQHPSALIRSGGKSSSKYNRWQARINEIFRIARLLENGQTPEDALASCNIKWAGLFGLAGSMDQ